MKISDDDHQCDCCYLIRRSSEHGGLPKGWVLGSYNWAAEHFLCYCETCKEPIPGLITPSWTNIQKKISCPIIDLGEMGRKFNPDLNMLLPEKITLKPFTDNNGVLEYGRAYNVTFISSLEITRGNIITSCYLSKSGSLVFFAVQKGNPICQAKNYGTIRILGPDQWDRDNPRNAIEGLKFRPLIRENIVPEWKFNLQEVNKICAWLGEKPIEIL